MITILFRKASTLFNNKQQVRRSIYILGRYLQLCRLCGRSINAQLLEISVEISIFSTSYSLGIFHVILFYRYFHLRASERLLSSLSQLNKQTNIKKKQNRTRYFRNRNDVDEIVKTTGIDTWP